MGIFEKFWRKRSPAINLDSARRARAMVWSFITVSTVPLRLKHPMPPSTKRDIVLAFTFGAFDAAALRLKIGDIDTIALVAVFFIDFFKLSPEEAGTATGACMDMSNDPVERQFIQLGGETFLKWMAQTDESEGLMAATTLAEVFSRLDKHAAGSTGDPA